MKKEYNATKKVEGTETKMLEKRSYTFSNVNGHNITVEATSQEEANAMIEKLKQDSAEKE